MPQYNKLFLKILILSFLFSCADEYIAVDKTDMSPLYVVSTVPQNGSIGVARDLSPAGAVVINFSKALDEKYINENFFDFSCNGVKPESKISISEDKKVVSINLKQGVILPEQADCRVVISKLIKDSAGLPFYLSESSVSNALLNEDGGVNDVVLSDDISESKKEKRTGEGDYILRFVTTYQPLEIVSVTPQDKSIISVNDIQSFQGIVILFNKPLDVSSVNFSNFIVAGETTQLSLSEDKKSVTITLLNGIQEGKSYDFTIMPFVTDESGVILGETYNYSFGVDYLKPQILSVVPLDGAMDVDYKLKEIKIEFNKDMNPATINNYTIVLSGVDNYSVRYEDKSAYVEGFLLKENREYNLVISSEIEDMSGFNLDKTYYYTFKTRFDVPYVKTIFPSDKAQNVPNNLSAIEIEFSEEMDFSNLNASYFDITPQVPFNLKIVSGSKLRLEPQSNLISGNTYNVRIKNFLSDTSGIMMDKDFESSFSVALTPDNNPPSDILIYSKPILEPLEDYRRGFILEWKAPAADEINGKLTGKVRGYSLVYSDQPFDKSEFANMTELSQLPTPSNPGDIQNITLYSFIDKNNVETPIIYNKPYYFMLRATDGTYFVYSNLLKAGILSDKRVMFTGSKYFGFSMKYIDNFNGVKALVIGDTDEMNQNKKTGAVFIYKIEGDNLELISRLYGKYEDSLFGYKVEAADINNDGCKDLIVSVPLDGDNREGAVYIYPQTKNGNICNFVESEPKRVSSGNKDSMFGLAISTINLNNKENLLIGAPSDGVLSTGSVYIYYNNDLSQMPSSGDLVINGKFSGSSFGYSVASGDINNDGCSDIIVSSPDMLENSKGRVYVFYSTSGVGGCTIQNTDVNTANLVLSGTEDYTRLGYNLITLDLNGDGKIELVMSGRDETNNRGIIFIRDSKTQNLLKITGENGGNFGYYLQSASDYLKDGCKNSPEEGCMDLFVSDVKLNRVYLIEGRENISELKFEDSPRFGEEFGFGSFGHSFAIVGGDEFEGLIVASPFVKEFEDFVSRIIIYR